MTVLAQFAGAAAEVIGALHQSTFPKVLTETLMNLTGAEDGTLLWFRDDDLPEVAFNTNRLDGRPSTLASYLQGSFLLDPFYRAATAEGQRGVFALSDLAVARNQFVAPGPANGLWGTPLYFVSQLLLAASIAPLGHLAS